MSASLLRVRGVGRTYGHSRALAGVDVDLGRGESRALLGPNGAGKTTLLGVLAGVTRPSSGSLEWSTPAPPAVGWVPTQPAVYPRLTVRENLRLFAALEGQREPDRRADELIERADLGQWADRPARQLSTGTLQRLNLAVALAGQPALLLLDEPTATLSPEQRRRLWAWLHRLRDEDGVALLFSTQSIDEARRQADRVLVLVGGGRAFDGTVDQLCAAHGLPTDPEPEAAEAAYLRLVGAEVVA